MSKKKSSLIFVLALLMLSVFSTSAFCWTTQQVKVPYVTVNPANGYWTGLAINNPSSSAITVNLYMYDESGALVGDGDGWCWTIPGKGTKIDLLENFYRTTTISGKFSLRIIVEYEFLEPFKATVFVGNNGSSNPGFAFQTYDSTDFSTTVYRCIY